MRDILITLIVLTGCIYTLKKPYIGILLWSWLSLMNPHRLAYGFAFNMPYAQITALTLIFSMFFSKEKQKIPINHNTIIWLIFIIFMGVTTFFAYYPTEAVDNYIKVLKVELITLITIALITDFEKLKKLIWVIAVSIGYFSIKGGIFTILTLGKHRVWGPPGSYIEDNNSLAVAVLMTIPLMLFLYQTTVNKTIKIGLFISIALSLFTALGSQSRGAFLAITVVGMMYWWESKNKLITMVIMLAISSILLFFLPESWYRRMETINTYEEDRSAMGRLNAWEYAFNAANHNVLGMGFDNWSLETFIIYAPDPTWYQAAHSIYFSVLGDHGWIGLFLFLMILYFTYKKINIIIKKTKNNPQLHEYHILAKMLKVGFVAYLVGGAFLSLAYYDLPWLYIGMTILIDEFVKKITI